MSELMVGLEFVRVYLEDCLISSKICFQNHMRKLEMGLKRISNAGSRMNAEKSYFGRKAIRYMKGVSNIVADVISLYPITNNPLNYIIHLLGSTRTPREKQQKMTHSFMEYT